MADESSPGGLGARLLVILYSIGLVSIGAYDIQRKHGNIVQYLTKESTVFASSLIRRTHGKDLSNAPSDRSPGSFSFGSIFGREDAAVEEPAEKDKKSLYKITPTDRKQLNKLINSL